MKKIKLAELRYFAELFDGQLSHTSIVEHKIDRLIHLALYHTSSAKKELIEQQIDMILAEGIIEPASGLWVTPIISIQKPSGEPWFCVDY